MTSKILVAHATHHRLRGLNERASLLLTRSMKRLVAKTFDVTWTQRVWKNMKNVTGTTKPSGAHSSIRKLTLQDVQCLYEVYGEVMWSYLSLIKSNLEDRSMLVGSVILEEDWFAAT